MPPDNSTNAPGMGPTSRSAPNPLESESAFLERQTADAKLAIRRVMADVAGDLTTTIDPRAWMKVAPWTSLAGALLTGFAATAAVVPSREQQMLRRLRKLERELHEKPAEASDRSSPKRSSLLTLLFGQTIRALQPVVMSAISAALATKATQSEPHTGDPGPSGNGRNVAATPSPDNMPGI